VSKLIQAIRGMNDLLPEAVARWQQLESAARQVLDSYGYREIRLPLLEKTELFSRSIGELTDIVAKEMYSFEDRNGESLTLRPEATAGIVRAGLEHGLLHNQIQRLWHAGPMFRHERPQKGRYRQFHQIDVEAFGLAGPDIDAELILLTARLWRVLEIDGLALEINSLGTPQARARYREALVRYLESRRQQLDEDSLRRLERNPLRILDSKNPAMRPVITDAPDLLEYLDGESRAHFEGLKGYLDDAGIRYIVSKRLVRGLDYYTRTVFEWTTDRLGAQGTVCGGGRYDGLVEQLGGRPTPATGFALGLERLVDLLAQRGDAGTQTRPQVYLVILGDALALPAMAFAERLRDQGLRVQCNCGGGLLKTQLKRADRSGARFALLLGEEEDRQQSVSVKDLRSDLAQRQIGQTEAAEFLKRQLG